MTWTRLDDRWTDRPELERLPYETRWHYLAMIQFCSRTDRVDGLLTIKDARRCSDVGDPAAAVADLLNVGLLETVDSRLRLVEIHDHVPPPGVRLNAQKSKIRMRRKRAHDDGDHSMCLPTHCSKPLQRGDVTPEVTRNPRTGRDRTA
jgi:hypothetical protein